MGLFSKIQTARSVYSTFGIIEILRVFLRKFRSRKTSNPLIKISQDISIIDKKQLSNRILSQILGIDESEIKKLRREFSAYQSYINHSTVEQRTSFFHSEYDLGSGMSEILYLAIRSKLPAKVIETGVAAGVSTNLILYVLHENGFGNCVSIDITEKVGEVIENDLKRRWKLQVLPEFSREKAFKEILIANSDATVFLHDSDHSDSWQIKEFCGVIDMLIKVEVILFDDITETLIHFIQKSYPDFRIFVINEGEKYSGVIYKSKFI